MEKATKQKYHKLKPKPLVLNEDQIESIVEGMIDNIKRIDTKTSCGPDGVHPSWLDKFDSSKQQDRNKLKDILRSGLQSEDFFSSRAALIPKKDTDEKRPIQVLNVPLRLLEKSLLTQVNRAELLDNRDDHYGFIKHRSTHDAYTKLEEILKIQDTECLFVDFTKAYNSVSHRKLIDIIYRKYDRGLANILKQMITNQNVMVYKDHYYKPGNGIPQGSSLSPFLFNLYMDEVITILKQRCPGMKFITYADDLVIYNQIDFEAIKEVTQEYNLHLNLNKCVSFRKRCRGIKMCKTFKYLGTRIKQNGDSIGYTTLRKQLLKTSKFIKRIGKYNPFKGYKLHNAIVGGKLNFYKERFDNIREGEYITLLKTSISIPRGVNIKDIQDMITASKTRRDKEEYFNIIIRLMRFHGTKKLSDRSINLFKLTEEMKTMKINELEQRLTEMKYAVIRNYGRERRPRGRPRRDQNIQQGSNQQTPENAQRRMSREAEEISKTENLLKNNFLLSLN